MAKNVEKDTALEQVLADIEKQFGKGAIMKLGEQEYKEIEVSPSGSLSLDIALGAGGYPKGRIIEIMDLSLQVKLLLHFTLLQKYKKMVVELLLLMQSIL